MNRSPLVSIIIPTYNRAHFIQETLDSILAQTYVNWECIVIDDGSTDHTAEVMEKYISKDARFQYHHRPKDRPTGGNAARNYGFEMSKGEFIQWFDSDDLMMPENIEVHLKILFKNCKRISIGLLNRYNDDFSILKKEAKKHKIVNSIYYDFILRTLKAHLPTTFFHKSILENYRLNEVLKKSQEVEFFQRIFRENEDEIVLFDKVLVKVRRHNESITGNLTGQRLEDVLKVKLILIQELPKNSPRTVRKKLFLNYMQRLKIAFQQKHSSIFIKYLFYIKLSNKLNYLFLIFLYLVYYISNRGEVCYKHIIHKMQIQE